MAYADIDFISPQTITEILKDSSFKTEINHLFSEDLQLISILKNMCQLYKNLLNSPNDSDQMAAYSLGANIIFNLRKVLLGRDITILVGATTVKNKHLRLGEYALTDILKDSNLYNVNQNELDLIAALENWNKLNTNTQFQRNAVWKKILDAQELEGPGQDFDASKPEGYAKDIDDANKKVELYRRNRIDRNVYYGYNNKDSIIRYYKTGGNSFQFFNQGWLFEHFIDKWSNATSEQKQVIIKQSLSANPVKIAISKTDSVPGYKGGDFRKGNKDYQAKYGNQKIISTRGIKEVMDKINNLLDNYTTNIRQLGVDFAELFTHKNNLDSSIAAINQDYNDIINDLGKKISKKLTVNVAI